MSRSGSPTELQALFLPGFANETGVSSPGRTPGHVEAGEERFLVEWDKSTGRVWYDILAFSRPRHLLTRLGNWQVRRMQRRFAHESVAAMQRTVTAVTT